MGEYIRKGNTEIKIGVCDHLWLTRNELLLLKQSGYRGFYGGEYTNEIEEHLKSPRTLYAFRTHELTLERLETEDLYKLNKPVYSASFPLAFAGTIDHESFYESVGEHRKTNYLLPCAYTNEAKPFLNTHNRPEYFSAYIVGERYLDGEAGRTIFGCSSCARLFSISTDERELIMGQIKEYVKAYQVTANAI